MSTSYKAHYHFLPGDTVYFLHESAVHSRPVKCVSINITSKKKGDSRIIFESRCYEVNIATPGTGYKHLSLSDTEVYSSPKALAESIVSNFEKEPQTGTNEHE